MKSTKAEVLKRVEEVYKLRLGDAEFADIREYALAPEQSWGVSDGQLWRYIAAADKLVKERFNAKAEHLLPRHLLQRRNLFAHAMGAGDFRTALSVLQDEAKLEGLYPATKIAPTTPDGQQPWSPILKDASDDELATLARFAEPRPTRPWQRGFPTMTQATLLPPPEAIYSEQCRRRFPLFADRYCQVLSEAVGPTAAWVPFKLWPAQREVAQKFQDHRLIVALKARQLGLTWLALAYALWHVLLHPIATVLLFSRRDDEATDLLARLKDMHRRLPSWLRCRVVTDNGHEWALANGSRVLAFPTTAGDSYTATLAIVDEADLVPNLDALLRAVKPTIDAAGRLLLISRADKGKPESAFKRIYRAAQEDGSDWHPIFLPWSARPDRTPAWYAAQKRDIQARTGALDDLFEQYPATDGEALAPRSLDKRLPAEWLQRCYRPTPPLTPGKGWPALPRLTVYAVPQVGRRYVVGADPAEGNPTSDESAEAVLDVDSGEEVATLAGRYEPVTFADYAVSLAKWYHYAAVMVERNNHGHAVLAMLCERAPELTRLCGDDHRPGWNTMVRSKARLYAQTGEALRDGETIIHALETFAQLASIEGSTLRAPEGQFDDRATAFALALAGRVKVLLHSDMTEGPVILSAGRNDPFGGSSGSGW